jgi:hypothetical protein
MLGFLARRKRRRLRALPLSDHEKAVLERAVPYARCMPAELRVKLEGLMRVFLAEKSFEGCGGLEVDEAMRITIAAQACILLAGLETDEAYPLLYSVLVYPGPYVAEGAECMPNELVEPVAQERVGESWVHGSVVLSWDDVERGVSRDGVNVVFHEFAHQLDHETGSDDGTPRLDDEEFRKHWVVVMTAEYQSLVRSVDAGERTLLDEYGAESPAEFFAVATECFFELPRRLRERHPQLYDVLGRFYRQDPAAWVPPAPELRRRVRFRRRV